MGFYITSTFTFERLKYRYVYGRDYASTGTFIMVGPSRSVANVAVCVTTTGIIPVYEYQKTW